MGLEGLVSKGRDCPYRGGRSNDWIKVKNRSYRQWTAKYDNGDQEPARTKTSAISGDERKHIQRQLEQVNSALDLLDRPEPQDQ
jgi:hypothetical protein